MNAKMEYQLNIENEIHRCNAELSQLNTTREVIIGKLEAYKQALHFIERAAEKMKAKEPAP